MDTIVDWKVFLGIAAVVIALVNLLFNIAKSSSHEKKKVTYALKISLFALVIVWNVFQIYAFVIKDGFASRLEIFLFALAILNTIAYSGWTLELLVSARKALQFERLEELKNELAAAKKATAESEMKAYVQEQLLELTQGLLNSSKS